MIALPPHGGYETEMREGKCPVEFLARSRRSKSAHWTRESADTESDGESFDILTWLGPGQPHYLPVGHRSVPVNFVE